MWPDKRHGRRLAADLGGGLQVWRCLGCRTLVFQLWLINRNGRARDAELLRFGDSVAELRAWAQGSFEVWALRRER